MHIIFSIEECGVCTWNEPGSKTWSRGSWIWKQIDKIGTKGFKPGSNPGQTPTRRTSLKFLKCQNRTGGSLKMGEPHKTGRDGCS